MKTIDPVLKSEYLKRVYMAVDGLWYINVEKHCGFETALEINKEVWQVMPKIAARKIKELLKLPHGKLESLSESLAFRFAVEGYEVGLNRLSGQTLEIQITSCPWRLQIIKSGNEKLLSGNAERVCPEVYKTWGREFLDQFGFEMNPQMCKGGENCLLKFYK